MAEGKSNIQEMPPPYHVGQHTPTSSDVKKEGAGYPQQAAACYPTGLRPTQCGFPQQAYPTQVAYNPQQGYPLQSYPQNMVVVVGQPAPAPVMATPTTLTVQPAQKKAKDFLIFSVTLMMLCFFHGNILNGILTLPALICSLAAQDYNRSGNYTGAKQCGYMALGCNIAVIVWFVLEIITIVIVIGVVLGGTASRASSRSGYYYCSGYYSSYC